MGTLALSKEEMREIQWQVWKRSNSSVANGLTPSIVGLTNNNPT